MIEVVGVCGDCFFWFLSVCELVSPCPNTMFSRKKSGMEKASSGSRKKGVRPPNVETMDTEFDDQASLEYFAGLCDRTIRPTRFYVEEEVDKLGIRPEVEYLMRSLGWEHFMTMKTDT